MKHFRTALPIATLVLLIAVAAPASSGHHEAHDGDFDVHAYIGTAAQGKLGPFVEWIDGDTQVEGRPAQFLSVLRERLGREAAPRRESTGLDLLDDTLAAYRDYWRQAIRGELGDGESREVIAATIDSLLTVHDVERGTESNPLETLLDELRAEGFHVQGGRTRPFEDLFVWRDDQAREFEVDLGDTTVTVTVHFMADFVSQGWMGWVTADHAHAGGWAKEDALYCMADRYELDSEKFLISYLKHEGRHFVDYVRFPELDQIDLEYRAKLTEIVHLEDSLPTTMETFIGMAAPNPVSPHAIASHAVVLDLERLLGHPPQWESDEDIAALKAAANELLGEHARLLEERGAATIAGVIEERFADDIAKAQS